MPKIRPSKAWGRFFPEYELRRRETGFNCNIGWEGNLKYSLYSSLYPLNSWDPIFGVSNKKESCEYHGGIFNLEFSPDGSQLVAACEKKAVMIFDPLTRRQIYDVAHAHSSCVNGIKFLDKRLFATCSDDKTVALWDARNLSREIVRLRGHNNWVKNIEYSSEDGLLVTSGFDGRILGWNINSYTSDSVECSELFSMQGLMRMRLTPDLTKLIICTGGGYMVVVHNLSLKNLHNDLNSFQPDLYRLMQISNTPLPQPSNFTNLFYQKRNRIEFISDFPAGNNAEAIHSLQVHPQGWCVLSRNTSTGDTSEWTCVHDIQELAAEEEFRDGFEKASPEEESPNEGQDSFHLNSSSSNTQDSRSQDLQYPLTVSPRVEVMLRQTLGTEEPNEEVGNEDEDEEDRGWSETRQALRRRRFFTTAGPLSVLHSSNIDDPGLGLQFRFTSMDVFEALENIESDSVDDRWTSSRTSGNENAGPSGMSSQRSGTEQRLRAAPPRQDFRLRRRRDHENGAETRGDYRSVFFIRPGPNSHRSILVLPPRNSLSRGIRTVDKDIKIPRNAPRLTNFIEEPNKGKGFIKELCFSSDGRLICSPFDRGVRLMMFDEKCSELSHCVQKTPQLLHAISNNSCHSHCVVSTKFSPVDCLLVSGCLYGKIVWHQPII